MSGHEIRIYSDGTASRLLTTHTSACPGHWDEDEGVYRYGCAWSLHAELLADYFPWKHLPLGDYPVREEDGRWTVSIPRSELMSINFDLVDAERAPRRITYTPERRVELTW